MVILDTNLVTLLFWSEHPDAQLLTDRLKTLSAAQVATTIISFEEQMRGWLAAIAKAKTVKDQVDNYRRLVRVLEQYCIMNILEFDERAAIEYQQLKKQKIRVGSMDLKIAAIALANDALLLSRNLRDFQPIPGLRVEDWTQPEQEPLP